MIKQIKSRALISVFLAAASFFLCFQEVRAQVDGTIPQEIKWLSVGSLRSWFSNGGAEIEYGRRGRTSFETVDQLDGMSWPQNYNDQDISVGKSMWIGTTNFDDPVSGINYPYKVICGGRLFMYLGIDIFPVYSKLVAKSDHPQVYVDNLMASRLDYDDEIDEIDPDLPADRMIEQVFHTSIGITVTRRIYAWSQQYHDNYFIYEYSFKNTGIIDLSGEQKLNKTLTDVVFHWQFRYGFAGESYHAGWLPTGASWGLNTINDAIGMDAGHPGDFRAIWAYYGPHSSSPGWAADIGLPNHTNGNILAGTNYGGVVVLHADRSASDHSDDPAQPSTSQFMPSDRGAQGVDGYDASLMARKYTEFMTAGHPGQTHAEQVGTTFADNWGGDNGGYASALGFGPYTIAIGDSINIAYAECVDGLMDDRVKVKEIAHKWFNDEGPFDLPGGGTTTDRTEYKNAWVLSGKDSLFQTFRRAIANYNSGFSIPETPPAPETFNVASGGNKITLTWASNAESWPNFDGYRIFRAEGRIDTTYEEIFSCDAASAVNLFEDKTANRGFHYYYYIQSKDDGSTNTEEPGVPLYSSKFYTRTTYDAFLTRPPEDHLDSIRVVPNPYNIRARELQFGVASPDQLSFFGLPPKCTIKIYTESGTLIETIEHTNGSGDEMWFSLTSSRQIVVSGIYIAYFEVTEDYIDDVTGERLLKKGDATFRKFVIIR